MSESKLGISVVIPTRNRGAAPLATVASILSNAYPQFEVIVVDQSTNLTTYAALSHFESDTRFRYIQSDKTGTGWARWSGHSASQHEIVAMTDDDCIVADNWLESIASCFEENPSVGLVFTDVLPGSHDSLAGYVPHIIMEKECTICKITRFFGHIGMGASMAFHNELLCKIGGFDRNFGPGSPFRSGEDLDVAIRVLLSGWCILQTNKTSVTHNGFRNWSDYRELTKRDAFAAGATFAKHLRLEHWKVIPWMTHWLLFDGLINPLSKIFKGHAPRGLKRFVHFLSGFRAGWTFAQ